MPDPQDPRRILEARALALLARREYTRAELARRLARPPAARPRRGRAAAASLADEFAPPPGAPGDAGEAPWDDTPEPRDAVDPELIEAVLDALVSRGLLSDARAAEAIVHAHGSCHGLLRVRQSLEQHGVPEDLAQQALGTLRAQQLPLAREVWRKRFGTLPQDAAERARQTRFLASRGFAFEVIRAVLGGADED